MIRSQAHPFAGAQECKWTWGILKNITVLLLSPWRYQHAQPRSWKLVWWQKLRLVIRQYNSSECTRALIADVPNSIGSVIDAGQLSSTLYSASTLPASSPYVRAMYRPSTKSGCADMSLPADFQPDAVAQYSMATPLDQPYSRYA